MTTNDIVADALQLLDAEGSERYLWSEDFQPAINSSVDWMVALYSRVIADTKRPEEALSEIAKRVRIAYPVAPCIFLVSQLSNSGIWSILGIECNYANSAKNINKVIPYKRLTAEQVGRASMNCFTPGNSFSTFDDENFEGGYLSPMTYRAGASTVEYLNGIQLLPKTPPPSGTGYTSELVVTIAELPTRISASPDPLSPEYPVAPVVLSLPDRCRPLLIQKVAQLVSLKEFGSSNMYAITSTEIQQLSALMS